MTITHSSKGTPVITLGKYTIIFTNTDSSTDKFKWLTITSPKGLRSVAPVSLEGLKTSIVPMKVRNRMKKVFDKYNKGGFIHKGDIESIHSELQTILGESVTHRIDNLLTLLG